MEMLDRLRAAVSGQYEVGNEIGRGGMAVVYRAKDRQHGRAVAIKVMREELRTAVGAERFLREIQIVSRLQHPNIVPLLGSGRVDDLPYYVMPFVEGETLAGRLRREQHLPIPDALAIARQMAGALAYAHGQGVLHRDVKPQNILLSSGQPLLADFGVSQAVGEAAGDRLTSTGLTLGTPQYMSPEQAGGSAQIDGRTDVYSLGCVLFEMLAGEPPFGGPTAQAVLARHMHERRPSVQVTRPNVSDALQRVVETSLSIVPADRFPTADGLARAIAHVEAGRATRRWGTLTRFPRSWWFAATVGGVAVAAAIAIAIQTPPRLADPHKVVVYPLSQRTASTDVQAGADIALIIGAALEHAEPLRWLDGWRDLDQPERADPSSLGARRARAIARERGARYFIDGAISRSDDSTSVVLRLHDAVADSLVAQETVSAAAAGMSIHRPALAALARLLPRLLDPGRQVDLALIANRTPASIALWIQGERAYRRSRFDDALRLYQQAIAADSGFAFAAAKGVQAAIWGHRLQDVRNLLSVARSSGSDLPSRYLHFVNGVSAYLAGAADTAVEQFKQALSESPDWAEAWNALGEVQYHLIPSKPRPDSLAEVAFATAWQTDSGFTPPAVHLTEIALRRGDIARVKALAAALPDSTIDISIAQYLALFRTCVERGRTALDWRSDVAARLHVVMLAAKGMSGGGAQPGCAEDGFRSLLGAGQASVPYRWAAVVGLFGLLAAQGRPAEAAALLTAEASAGLPQALYLSVFGVLAGAPMQQQAIEMEAAARSRYGNDYATASPHVHWLLGVWHAHLGDRKAAQRLLSRLQAAARTSGARRQQILAASLAAHLSLTGGDTTAAISQLRRLTPTAPRDSLVWDVFEPLAADRYLLARVLLRRGRAQEAHDVATVFDHPQPVIYLAFLAPSLGLRLQAARTLDRPALSERYRLRLKRLNRGDLVAANQ